MIDLVKHHTCICKPRCHKRALAIGMAIGNCAIGKIYVLTFMFVWRLCKWIEICTKPRCTIEWNVVKICQSVRDLCVIFHPDIEKTNRQTIIHGKTQILATNKYSHDDVIKWKHFPRYWPFVREIYSSPVNSPHKGQRRGALMFSLICVWINGWVNTGEGGDLRRYRAHYDVTVMN